MPVTLSQISSNTATITFQAGATPDETVTFVYYPGHVTEKSFSVMAGLNTQDQHAILAAVISFNEMLVDLIKSWDLLENDGSTPFPLDATRFAELPLGFRMQIFQLIMGDIRPNMAASQTLN